MSDIARTSLSETPQNSPKSREGYGENDIRSKLEQLSSIKNPGALPRTHESILALQIALDYLANAENKTEYNPGKRDGIYRDAKQTESETMRAVRAFQRDHGLEVDGWAGPKTINILIQKVNIALENTAKNRPSQTPKNSNDSWTDEYIYADSVEKDGIKYMLRLSKNNGGRLLAFTGDPWGVDPQKEANLSDFPLNVQKQLLDNLRSPNNIQLHLSQSIAFTVGSTQYFVRAILPEKLVGIIYTDKEIIGRPSLDIVKRAQEELNKARI